MICRTISDSILQVMNHIPVITITGPRQSGKTTFVKELFPDYKYLLKEKLDMKRIFEIKKLEKLNVQVGFWIFGGMKMRKHGESLKSINVQPKRKRAEIRKFYNLTS